MEIRKNFKKLRKRKIKKEKIKKLKNHEKSIKQTLELKEMI